MSATSKGASHPMLSPILDRIGGRWSKFLLQPSSAIQLALWRVLFGMLMAYSAVKYYLPRTKTWHYSSEVFHFTYPGFSWVKPLSSVGMEAEVALMAIAAFCLAIGLFYRIAAVLFFLTYTHLFLIDQVHYNNHYYMFCMVACAFCFVDANRALSVDVLLRGVKGFRSIPHWQLFVFQSLVAIVYFFGGVAKINPDWLRGEPMGKFLLNHADSPLLGHFAASDSWAIAFAYGGMLLDLGAGVGLFTKWGRRILVPGLLVFHITNSFLFDIGVFPWSMVAALVLFIPSSTVEKVVLKRLPDRSSPGEGFAKPTRWQIQWIPILFSIFLAIQFFLPLRHFLRPGDCDWRKESNLFAWRMKIHATDSQIQYFIVEKESGRFQMIDPSGMLSRSQYRYIADEPRLLARFAKQIHRKMSKEGYQEFEVRCAAIASKNGRPYHLLIDPTVDLSVADDSTWRNHDWITQLNKDDPIGNYAINPVPQMKALLQSLPQQTLTAAR